MCCAGVRLPLSAVACCDSSFCTSDGLLPLVGASRALLLGVCVAAVEAAADDDDDDVTVEADGDSEDEAEATVVAAVAVAAGVLCSCTDDECNDDSSLVMSRGDDLCALLLMSSLIAASCGSEVE